jgi:hypothetical protein
VATTFGVLAQGSVQFHNEYWQAWGDAVDRNVYLPDGVTGVDDSTWSARLVEFDGTGYVEVAPKTYFYGTGLEGVFAWDGNTYTANSGTLAVEIYDGQDNMLARSPDFTYLKGNSSPPAPKDVFIVNFPGMIVPEPSTIALGVLGIGALLLFRRRK